MKAIQNKTIDFISFRTSRCFAGKACETFSSLFFLLPTHFKSFFFCRLFSDTFVMMCSKFALNVTNKFSNSEFRNVVCLVNSIFMTQSRKGGSGRPNVSKQCIIADVGTEKITSSFLINFDRGSLNVKLSVRYNLLRPFEYFSGKAVRCRKKL